jgi:acetoin utilization deacetylase AcuC-like enzyme
MADTETPPDVEHPVVILEEEKKDQQILNLDPSFFPDNPEEIFNLEEIVQSIEAVDTSKGDDLNLSFDGNVFDENPHEEISTTESNLKGEKEETEMKVNRLAIYFHPKCALHLIPDHPEQPRRVEVILKALRNQFKDYANVSFRQATECSDEHIQLYHTNRLLDSFQKKWEETNTFYKTKNKVIFREIDGDTQIMHATRDAAYLATGSVINAVDHIYNKTTKSSNSNNNNDPQTSNIDMAFCCIRPPGHHAEPNKSGGFCFFNNVAIGAIYAQEQYQVKKVAVLDFDVHHGNGTEAGFKDNASLFYGSTHEKYCYPGTGDDPSPFTGEKARTPVHRRIVDRYLHAGHTSREEFHRKWIEILKEMEIFQPNLILISAGFDAHDDDPLASCELVDSDYEWVTTEILKSGLRIDSQNPPPIISALEGGYDLDAITISSLLHVKRLLQGYDEDLKNEIAMEAGNTKETKDYKGNEVDALQQTLKDMGIE